MELRSTLIAFAFAVACLPASAATQNTQGASREEHGNPNPRIVAPNAQYEGLTYGEWLVRLNQWLLGVPAAAVSPIFPGNEGNIALGQPNHVWFLANVVPVLGGDALPGTYGPMVADGYAVLIKPLPVGEHTIHITGTVIADPSDRSHDVHVDITWRITVAPHG